MSGSGSRGSATSRSKPSADHEAMPSPPVRTARSISSVPPRETTSGIFGPCTTKAYPEGPAELAGMGARTPWHDPGVCEGTGACARACPTESITIEGTGRGARLRLDYGACIFCRKCVDACPTGAMRAVGFFELAVRSKEDLVARHVAGGALGANPSPPSHDKVSREVRERISRLFSGSLAVRAVDAGSCNGCEVEVSALSWPAYDAERLGIHFVASPRHADALLVTGPVNRNMRLALQKTLDATPDPKFLVIAGACGISGGPFRRSKEVEGGVPPSDLPSVWVPGCPPRPEALLYAFWLALGRLEQQLKNGELPPKVGGSSLR